MREKKTLKELTIKDNFMFGAVMCEEENCKGLLEMILQIPIACVKVSKEKSILYHPEYKGVRLDVYAMDEKNTHYNVEMQAVRKKSLSKRARYYHSQIDMELLHSGTDYEKLPDSYVIFICDFDPFGKALYQYTFENKCAECTELERMDGNRSIFLSTKGKNDADVPIGLVKFLKYVGAGLAESEQNFEDKFIEQIQKSVQYVKKSREMEERYMLFEELLKDERAEGKAEGKVEAKSEMVIDFLEELGTIPSDLREQIMQETNLGTLSKWTKMAAKADSIEQFLKEI